METALSTYRKTAKIDTPDGGIGAHLVAIVCC
jgi:hypothetical protein